MSANWREFFDAHAPHYMKNPFTANTRFEVDFLIEVLDLLPGSHILDVGCGTGRHAVELVQRGYRVTGIDLSQGMLEEALKAAAQAGVDALLTDDPASSTAPLTLVLADATTFESDLLYDAAICLCEGGMGLAGPNEDPIAHDLAILRTISRALRPNGIFVMTALNGYATLRQMTDEMVNAGRFDPATMLSVYEDEWDLPEGKRTMTIRERLLIPPEMVAMLRHVGFGVEAVWGGTAGEWGRRPLKLDEVEAMYVSRKL